MTRDEMKPSDGFFFVYVTDDGPIRSDDMTRDQLLFVLEGALNERDSLREERKWEMRRLFDVCRRWR